MTKSAYIHIPFCKSKCKYCSFISYTKPDMITGYIYALLKDISDNYRGEELRTLYFGGGTPSLVPAELLGKVISKFKFQNEYELTVEVNPDDCTPEYLQALIKQGVNRLSIGSQTFDDNILKLIGRRHNSSDIIRTVEFAKNAGFENISVDLIYGLPTQTLEGLRQDLDKFLSLEIQHISTYGLKIEADSYWGKIYDKELNALKIPDYPLPNLQIFAEAQIVNSPSPPSADAFRRGVCPLPNDDTQADMYEGVNEILERNGFYRYEVSNFAKKGYESKHNLNYWNNNEYYGFGAAAHGYVDGVRFYNYSELEKYMAAPSTHEYGKTLTEDEKLEEEIFLGFRKREGVNVNKIKEKFGIDFENKYRNILEKYSGFIEKTPAGFTLNLKGVLISNIILADFIE